MPSNWTGLYMPATIGFPWGSSSLSVANYTMCGIYQAFNFFDSACPLDTGIWGLGTGSLCQPSGICPLVPLMRPFVNPDSPHGAPSAEVPFGLALQLCGPGSNPANTDPLTVGGRMWLGGADSRFLARPFSWFALLDGSSFWNQTGYYAVDARYLVVDGKAVANITWSYYSPVILDSGTSLLVMGSLFYGQTISAMQSANFITFSPDTPPTWIQNFWSGSSIVLPCSMVTIGSFKLGFAITAPNGTLHRLPRLDRLDSSNRG